MSKSKQGVVLAFTNETARNQFPFFSSETVEVIFQEEKSFVTNYSSELQINQANETFDQLNKLNKDLSLPTLKINEALQIISNMSKFSRIGGEDWNIVPYSELHATNDKEYFNFDFVVNQENYTSPSSDYPNLLSDANVLRNVTPYNISSVYGSYQSVFNPKYYTQLSSEIENVTPGELTSIDIVSGGDNY